MSATRSSLGTTAPSSTLISDRIARRIVRLDRAARSPWSSLTQSCQALSPRRDEIGRYQSVRVRSRIGTKRGRFACSTFERIESPGCPPKRSRRRATSATRSSSASARSTPRGIVSSQACSLDASHEKYWRSRQRRPGCKAAVESTSTGLTKSFCPFRLPSRGRQDRSTDAPILTRSRLRRGEANHSAWDRQNVYADRQRRIAERATGWAEQIDARRSPDRRSIAPNRARCSRRPARMQSRVLFLTRLTYRQLLASSSCSLAPFAPNSASAATSTT